MSTLLAFFLFFQTTNATISGTVTDPTGAAVPNVQIEAANTKTGIVFKTVSNEAGVYQFPSVQPGTYKLTAELPGFR
jgi:protocatechuate 3,4-dioxygenase beta subunit